MRRSYGRPVAAAGHVVSDGAVVAVAVALVVGMVLRGSGGAVSGAAAVGALAAIAVSGLLGTVGRRRALAACLLGAALLGALRGGEAWHDAVARRVGPFTGWAEVVGDPAARGAAVQVTLEVEGERFDARLTGSAARRAWRLGDGEAVLIRGTRHRGGGSPAATHRMQVRHVVGRIDVDVMADVRPGSPVTVSANRVRALLRVSADAVMNPHDASLFTGLVVGDDARQPRWLVDRFRAAGLSHLCAVSGQNVAYFLAVLAPVVRRFRPSGRAVVTTVAVAWFCLLSRFEPSVLRAGAMAVLSVWAVWRGRSVSPVRSVALAASVLVVLDPLLVWSVGFWLSVGATVGVSVLAPAVVSAVWGPARRPGMLAVTLGAQAGVALPGLVVFGRLPVASVASNLMAVPVAGVVMLWGFPAAVAHRVLPAPLGAVAMWPCAVGTQWVGAVAAAGAEVEVGAWWNAVGWALLLTVTGALLRRARRTRTRVPS